MKEYLSQLRNKEIALCKKLHDLDLTWLALFNFFGVFATSTLLLLPGLI